MPKLTKYTYKVKGTQTNTWSYHRAGRWELPLTRVKKEALG